MDITLTFTLTPTERRQAIPAGSLWRIVRSSAFGLPIAAAGFALLTTSLKPGAASGWAFILTALGALILASPQIAVIRGGALRTLVRSTRNQPDTRFWVTLTEARLNYGFDDIAVELPWRRVTHIRATADGWIVTLKGSSGALVIPKRAIPASMETEVTEFLRQRSTAAGRTAVSG